VAGEVGARGRRARPTARGGLTKAAIARGMANGFFSDPGSGSLSAGGGRRRRSP
jgi:hypothetical protein